MAFRITDYEKDLAKLNRELNRIAADRRRLIELEAQVRRLIKTVFAS